MTVSTSKEFMQYLEQLQTDLLGIVVTSPEDYEDGVIEKEKINLAHFFKMGYSAEYLVNHHNVTIFFSFHGLFDALEAILKGKQTGLEVFQKSARFLKIMNDISDDDIPEEINMDFYKNVLDTYKTYIKPKEDIAYLGSDVN